MTSEEKVIRLNQIAINLAQQKLSNALDAATIQAAEDHASITAMLGSGGGGINITPTMVLSTVDSGLENAIWLEIDDE